MRLYFLLLDAAHFHHHLAPALADSWRERRFEPCRTLCQSLLTGWQTGEFAPARLAPDELLCSRIAEGGANFDRDLWRLLVGEVLLYSAAEIPEIETAPAALACLLGAPAGGQSREHFHWIEQVHYGTRDVRFGGAFYRPEHAGLNDTADVARLADCLAAVRPEHWQPAQLAALPGLETEEDRADELECVREWFPALCAMYAGARQRQQVMVCETP